MARIPPRGGPPEGIRIEASMKGPYSPEGVRRSPGPCGYLAIYSVFAIAPSKTLAGSAGLCGYLVFCGVCFGRPLQNRRVLACVSDRKAIFPRKMACRVGKKAIFPRKMTCRFRNMQIPRNLQCVCHSTLKNPRWERCTMRIPCILRGVFWPPPRTPSCFGMFFGTNGHFLS